MVSIGVEVTTVEARVCVVLIQSLSLSLVDPRVVLTQPVAILHLSLPGHVYKLQDTSKTLAFNHAGGVTDSLQTQSLLKEQKQPNKYIRTLHILVYTVHV